MDRKSRPRLLILTTCSAQKSGKSQDAVCLRDIDRMLPAEERVSRWIQALEDARVSPVEVSQLYQGAHWHQSLKALEEAKQHFEASLWVLSAGYGLIPAGQGVLIKPYQATFSRESGIEPAESNAVSTSPMAGASRTEYERAWWRGLSQWALSQDGSPRDVASLVRTFRPDAILIIASESYLQVIEDELGKISELIPDADRLVLISTGLSPRLKKSFSRHVLTCDARIARHLGGALTSLNARIAAWLLNACTAEQFSRRNFQNRVDEVLSGAVAVENRSRRKCTEDDVLRYLNRQPDLAQASATALLRRFRKEDHLSFEEKAFKRLVAQAKLRIAILMPAPN